MQRRTYRPKPWPVQRSAEVVPLKEGDGYSFSFDLSKAGTAAQEMPWVSPVYKFSGDCDLTYRTLYFDLKFGEGNFSRIDVEIKRHSDTYCEPSKVCRKTDNSWHSYDYDCDNLREEVRECMGEICFVVKADSADDKADMLNVKGEFSIRNLRFLNK